MAIANWDRAIASVLLWEGGYAARANEPGGHVNKGVSLASFREAFPNATVDDLKAITDEQAADFYRKRYAEPVGFFDAPGGLDVVLLHAAVMQGVTGARRLLFETQGAVYDGTWSPTIFDAVHNPLATANELLLRQARKKMCDPNCGTFGNGWSLRFVAVAEIAKSLVT